MFLRLVDKKKITFRVPKCGECLDRPNVCSNFFKTCFLIKLRCLL